MDFCLWIFSHAFVIINIMGYNIEFQLAGLVITIILNVIFFSKSRDFSIQNRIFSLLLSFTTVHLLFDIISVITIAERDNIPVVMNTFFAKGYIISMVIWIVLGVIYIFSNFLHEDIDKRGLLFFKIGCAFIVLPGLAVWIITFTQPLYYANYGRGIYSYGMPSSATYVYSVHCVIISVIAALLNFRKVPFKRTVPMLSFTIMQGTVAIIQMLNSTVLIIGFGTAVTVLIMFMTLEDPDMNTINNLSTENRRMRNLLANILSLPMSKDFKATSKLSIEKFDDATIAFIDLMDFQKLSTELGMEKLVRILNIFFHELDALAENYKIEKVRDFGKSYMVVSGVPNVNEKHAEEMIAFLADAQKLIVMFNERHRIDLHWKMTAHSGEVIAGLIADRKIVHDLWGNTASFAYLLGNDNAPDIIQVSGTVYNALREKYTFQQRLPAEVKGFGTSICYWLMDDNNF